ncbi:MAG: dipeptide epimerase [Phycisphaerae bacterium]|nr:dipeptide epimerase [Phycisphaerae bacterium]
MAKLKLEWRRQTLHTRHRWATAQGGINEKQTIVVSVEHEGLIGRGEATPSALFGQSLEGAEAALEECKELLGDDPFAIAEVLDRLIDHVDEARDVIAAVETALHDLAARKLKMPVWRYLGLPEPRIKTTFSIGIATPDEIREKVREALAAGFDRLKVKVGGEHDLKTLQIIRESFDGPLYLDANQGWTPETAPAKIREIAPFKPVLLEQPISKKLTAELKPLRELGLMPIFADEACERPTDIIRLKDVVDGVNIKFNKCGGIRQALAMIDIARACGLQIMLGCFVSSSLAIAPALAVASRVDHADLDGALLLADDPFTSLIACDKGLLTPRAGDGFGGDGK